MPGTGDKKETKIGSRSIGSPWPSVGTHTCTHTHTRTHMRAHTHTQRQEEINTAAELGVGGGPGSESSTLRGKFEEDSLNTGQAKGKNTRQARGKQGECPAADGFGQALVSQVRQRHHGRLAGICSVSGIILPALTPEGRSPGKAASKAAPGRRSRKRGREPHSRTSEAWGSQRGCLCLEVRGKARGIWGDKAGRAGTIWKTRNLGAHIQLCYVVLGISCKLSGP